MEGSALEEAVAAVYGHVSSAIVVLFRWAAAGYRPEEDVVGLSNPFLAVLGLLLRQCVLLGSFEQLTDWVMEIFELPYNRNTVLGKVKEIRPTMEDIEKVVAACRQLEEFRLKKEGNADSTKRNTKD